MPEVFIVLEGPDMTYYGSATIHGVYATREEAEAQAKTVDPTWKGESYEPLRVEEWEIGEGA